MQVLVGLLRTSQTASAQASGHRGRQASRQMRSRMDFPHSQVQRIWGAGLSHPKSQLFLRSTPSRVLTDPGLAYSQVSIECSQTAQPGLSQAGDRRQPTSSSSCASMLLQGLGPFLPSPRFHSSLPSIPDSHSSLLRPAPRCPSPTGSGDLHDGTLAGSAGRLPGRGRPVALAPQRSHFSDSAPHGDVDRSDTQLTQLGGERRAPPGPPRKDVTKAGPIGHRCARAAGCEGRGLSMSRPPRERASNLVLPLPERTIWGRPSGSERSWNF